MKSMFPFNGVYNSRAFDSFWTTIVRVFQALGVSHYSTFNATHQTIRSILFIIISVLHIFLLINILKYTRPHLHGMLNSPHKQDLMFYVSLMGLAGNIMTHIVSHLEPLLTKKHEQKVYRKLREIDQIFATKLNYITDYAVVRREFINHTVAYFVFDSLLAIGYSTLSFPNDAFDIFVYLSSRIVTITIIRARMCLIVFHVNTITNILKDLRILLIKQQTNFRLNSNVDELGEKIQYLRDVYSNVWILKNLISSCFGWSFITFLLELTCELINSSYWTYINFKRNLMDMRNIS